MDPISAVMGGVGMVGSVVGGIMGNSAAKKAGALQNAADQKAADDVTASTVGANKKIGDAATQAGTLAQSGAAGVTAAAGKAATGVTDASVAANARLDPYAAAGADASGTLRAGLRTGGDFNRTPTMADIQIDPGYAWRTQQGAQALEGSAFNRGVGGSGEAAKDLVNYQQGAASQEYANAFQRYETNTQNRYSNLFGVANQGQAAATLQGNNTTAAARYGGDITTAAANTQLGADEYSGTALTNSADLQGSNTIGTAKTAADYRTGGVAAQAAGIVGGANALTSGINGAINAGTSAVRFSQLMKNPALAPQGPQAPYYSSSTVNPDGSLTVHR